MEQVRIRCVNDGKTYDVPMGSTLAEAFCAMKPANSDAKSTEAGLGGVVTPVCARVNNKVEGMHYRLYKNKLVEFLDLRSPSGMRAYTRTLFFVLCKAVHDLYPESLVAIAIPVSNGYYCYIRLLQGGGNEPLPASEIEGVRHRMQEIIDENIPINRHEVPTEEAVAMFREKGDTAKASLLESVESLYTTYYQMDDYVDFYYGSLLTHTGGLMLFGLEEYADGVLLRTPSRQDPTQLGDMVRQDKMFGVFREHHRMQHVLGMTTVGEFNAAVKQGQGVTIMNVAEALQEKRLAEIANEIAGRQGVRMVLIAGPSSSGKTTTCKRLSIQMVLNGIRPVPISLDDYFVDREKTPRDETGDYDYESIYALNIPLLNDHLERLFKGEEVELPRYDFPTGRSVMSGRTLKLREGDVLVVEGIHALNPELTAQIAEEKKYRVYASALTTILLDHHNYIPTTDNRLLRRIVRDYKYRGCSAQETIRRWPSVRRGEDKWIFPFQENADVMFNTALIYEMAVIRHQAEPLLEQVPESCVEYAEAYRLRKFLRYFAQIEPKYLPHNSLLREFLGGSSFEY